MDVALFHRVCVWARVFTLFNYGECDVFCTRIIYIKKRFTTGKRSLGKEVSVGGRGYPCRRLKNNNDSLGVVKSIFVSEVAFFFLAEF